MAKEMVAIPFVAYKCCLFNFAPAKIRVIKFPFWRAVEPGKHQPLFGAFYFTEHTHTRRRRRAAAEMPWCIIFKKKF